MGALVRANSLIVVGPVNGNDMSHSVTHRALLEAMQTEPSLAIRASQLMPQNPTQSPLLVDNYAEAPEGERKPTTKLHDAGYFLITKPYEIPDGLLEEKEQARLSLLSPEAVVVLGGFSMQFGEGSSEARHITASLLTAALEPYGAIVTLSTQNYLYQIDGRPGDQVK